MILFLTFLLLATPTGSTKMSNAFETFLGTETPASEKFFFDNARLPEITTLPSGVQYKIVESGEGQYHPQPTAKCAIHYVGTLFDGSVFDNSYDRGAPSTFQPNQVIPGWTEILQLMVEGDVWEIYLPTASAYGSNSPTKKIPNNAALAFRLHLVTILSKNQVVLKQNTETETAEIAQEKKENPTEPANRTNLVGIPCHDRTDCGHNGDCIRNGLGFILDDKYIFIGTNAGTGEHKFMHHIMVSHIEPDSLAAASNIQVGDFIEHVNKIRDSEARTTVRKIAQLSKSMADSNHSTVNFTLGLVRRADPKIRALNYGEGFNISVTVKQGESLGFKLGNIDNAWGIKIRKVKRTGKAHSTNFSTMFLKHDIIRGINDVPLHTDATVDDFVSLLKKEKMKNDTLTIFGHRPLPKKKSKEWYSIRAQHLTVTMTPPTDLQSSLLGVCGCRGSWSGRACTILSIMGGGMTHTLETSLLNETMYDAVVEGHSSPVAPVAPVDGQAPADDSMGRTGLDHSLKRSTDYISISMYEESSIVVSNNGENEERVSEYHGLFWSVADDVSQLSKTSNVYRLGYANSFSPFGRFYSHVESTWSMESDTVPFVCIRSKNTAYVVKTLSNAIFVHLLPSINITTTSPTPEAATKSGGVVVGRPTKWDARIGDASLAIVATKESSSNVFVLVYVGVSESGRSSIGIATSSSWDGTFVRPATNVSSASKEKEGEIQETTAEGILLSDTVNVTAFHDPFMYMDEEGAYHILFMGTPKQEEAELDEETGVEEETKKEGKEEQEEEQKKVEEEKEDEEKEKEEKEGEETKEETREGRTSNGCTTAVYHISSASLTGPWSTPSKPSLECGQYDGLAFRALPGLKKATVKAATTTLDDKDRTTTEDHASKDASKDATKDVVELLTSIRRPQIVHSSLSAEPVGFYVSAQLKNTGEPNEAEQVRHIVLGAITAHTDDY